MRIFQLWKAKARQLKSDLTALYYASRDPRVGWAPKVIVAVALAYSLSPIDLIPDFIPVLGYLDDLIIVPALLAWAVRLIPPPVMIQARERAAAQPLRLKKSWGVAVVFVGVWVAVLVWVVLLMLQRL